MAKIPHQLSAIALVFWACACLHVLAYNQPGMVPSSWLHQHQHHPAGSTTWSKPCLPVQYWLVIPTCTNVMRYMYNGITLQCKLFHMWKTVCAKVYLSQNTQCLQYSHISTHHTYIHTTPYLCRSLSSNTHRPLAPGSGQLRPPCQQTQSHSGHHGNHYGILSHQLQNDTQAMFRYLTRWVRRLEPIATICQTHTHSVQQVQHSNCLATLRLTVADVSVLQWSHVWYTMANHLIHWPAHVAEGMAIARGTTRVTHGNSAMKTTTIVQVHPSYSAGMYMNPLSETGSSSTSQHVYLHTYVATSTSASQLRKPNNWPVCHLPQTYVQHSNQWAIIPHHCICMVGAQ